MRCSRKNSCLNQLKRAALFLSAALPFVVLSFFIASRLTSDGDTGGVRGARAGQPGEAIPADIGGAYSESVMAAVKSMGLSRGHLDAWQAEHPDSALRHVKYMSAEQQRTVASTAIFIRKSNGRIDAKTAWREAAALVHYSGKYGVPSTLSTAVAQVESTFDPNAVSPKGASGVMQVMWRIHNGLLTSNGIQPAPGKNPLADPEYAIAAGCLILSRYIKTYGSVQAAIDRYYGKSSASYQRKVNSSMARILTHRSQVFN
ncbi:MAG: lytic transglycosylase domain-containing protein [Synergistaceae bacterium]|jgi:soluble lytic murein transglycosylase-like protein|nr:lytic transglycosylase domain-containing protein [Synergistaceae bacterium]